MTMTLHNYTCRQFHRTSNGEKIPPAVAEKFFAHGHAHRGQWANDPEWKNIRKKLLNIIYAIPSKWSIRKGAETWKCDERMDGCTDGQTEGRTSGWRVFIFPLQLGTGQKVVRKEYLKMWKKDNLLWGCDLDLWPTTLTRSGQYPHQCVCQIWEQSIQCFFNYCANTMNTITAGGFRHKHKKHDMPSFGLDTQ